MTSRAHHKAHMWGDSGCGRRREPRATLLVYLQRSTVVTNSPVYDCPAFLLMVSMCHLRSRKTKDSKRVHHVNSRTRVCFRYCPTRTPPLRRESTLRPPPSPRHHTRVPQASRRCSPRERGCIPEPHGSQKRDRETCDSPSLFRVHGKQTHISLWGPKTASRPF